jgi:hypothetical protein
MEKAIVLTCYNESPVRQLYILTCHLDFAGGRNKLKVRLTDNVHKTRDTLGVGRAYLFS